MKNLTMFLPILFGIMITNPVYAQDIFPIDKAGEIVYSEVVTVDSVNSKELYVRAHEWFANNFKSAQDVIQLDDKEAGKLIGKGFFTAGIDKNTAGVFHSPVKGSVYFTVEIQTKDGKYKYTLNNFSPFYLNDDKSNAFDLKLPYYVKMKVWQKQLDKDWFDVKQDVNAKVLNLIEVLKKSMKTNTNNW